MSQAFQRDVHFGYEETRALVDQEGTCFKQVMSHQHVTLNPRFIGAVSKGIKEQLQDQLHLYSERLDDPCAIYIFVLFMQMCTNIV